MTAGLSHRPATLTSSYEFVDDFIARMGPAVGADVVDRGPLTSILAYALDKRGKLARPLVLLAANDVMGGDPKQVFYAALACEYSHIGSLLHDDVIDNDLIRRGRPSVLAKYGAPGAIVGGDALIFLLFHAMTRCADAGVPVGRVVRAIQHVAGAGVEMCLGQALEGVATAESDLSIETYLAVIYGKTATAFEAACAVGATLAGASPDDITEISRFGKHFGMAFQIQDDLLPYRSSGEAAGKSAFSDLENGRVTLPFLVALQTAARADRELLTRAQAMAAAGEQVADIQRVAAIIGREEVLGRCVEFERREIAQAASLLDRFDGGPGKLFLGDLIEVMAGRVA
ncbi:MAG TPA: polyprenyl synthetase family protein [Micromonosporaceae bacterium]|nr:polyprenyl synthetase family protein [Micromonosporaceae bacterium]